MTRASHTTTGYGPRGTLPRPPAHRHAQLALRALLIGTAVAVGVAAALVAAAASWVAHTGCFLGCEEPDPAAAWLWATGAVVALGATAWAVRRIWRLRPASVRAWSWLLAGAVAGAVGVSLVGSAVAAVVDARCTTVVQVTEDYSYVSCDPPAAAGALTALAGLAPLALGAVRARRALR